jgi:hypothetical protein
VVTLAGQRARTGNGGRVRERAAGPVFKRVRRFLVVRVDPRFQGRVRRAGRDALTVDRRRRRRCFERQRNSLRGFCREAARDDAKRVFPAWFETRHRDRLRFLFHARGRHWGRRSQSPRGAFARFRDRIGKLVTTGFTGFTWVQHTVQRRRRGGDTSRSPRFRGFRGRRERLGTGEQEPCDQHPERCHANLRKPGHGRS